MNDIWKQTKTRRSETIVERREVVDTSGAKLVLGCLALHRRAGPEIRCGRPETSELRPLVKRRRMHAYENGPLSPERRT